jgi:hypothetical protein
MAIAATSLATGTLTTNGGATSSVSPTGVVYLCLGTAMDSGPQTTASSGYTVTGCGLTWTDVTTAEINWATRRFAAVVRGEGTATPGTITVTFTAGGGGVFQSTIYAVIDVTGLDATPNDAAVSAQGTGATASVSGIGTPGAGDAVLSMFLHTTAANAMAPGAEAGTELADFADTAGAPNVRRMAVYFNSAPDGTPAPSATFTSDDWAGIAFILNAGAGGGGSTTHLKFNLIGVG